MNSLMVSLSTIGATLEKYFDTLSSQKNGFGLKKTLDILLRKYDRNMISQCLEVGGVITQ